MNVESMVYSAKKTLGQATAYAKEKIFELTGTPSASVSALAKFIPTHHDTKAEIKTFLGTNFIFYTLETMGVRYYLEMKGSRILQLDANMKDHQIVSYRSYRDQHSLNVPIRFP
ncbi:hypothetical protein F9802_13535 [Bacillus aerolatus]|uniref:Uncharacterized protein n=1 Tax=Bacillus aerolatus TaxID=2653354 RepID=A0A6I1FTB8_9BACI|nr:hypothetical protein [Bacillus aerolatus]KAB7705558.1 hypothetical protein F9802_13535 [Bacillus aerolatus]